MYDQAAARAAIDARRERNPVPMAAARAILRRVGWIHLDDHTAGAFSLARKDQDELTPSCVTDALGEMMILHHPFNIQIFHGDRVELTHDLERRLVVEIPPLAPNLLMFLLKQLDRFPASLRSLLTSGDFALSGLQLRFGLAQKFRILNRLARREGSEVLDPDIYANRLAAKGEESALVLLNCKDHIPTIHIALDHAGLDRPFNRTGEADATRTNFRQVKLVAFKSESALRIGEGIVSRGRLESRIARRLSVLATPEECVEGLIHSAQRVLKNLAVNLAYISTDLFDLRKLDGLRVIVDRKAVDLVGVAPFLQGCVVKLAANIQCSRASGHELSIGLELVFVRLHGAHYTLVTMANQQLQALNHCVFSLHFHLVMVTKYRRKAITKEMLERLRVIFQETLEKWHSELIEFNGEADHVHLLFRTNPTVQLSKLVNNLKTVSSRLIRRDFRERLKRIYRKPVFWHRSYCLITAGGATIEILRKYIEEQGSD